MSPTTLAAIALVVCGAIIIVSNEWRMRLVALVFQYVAVAALMSFEILPALGIVRLVAGAVAAMVLLQSFRHAARGSEKGALGGKDDASSPSLYLRLAVVLLAALTSSGLAQSFPMPNFPPDITSAAYWLVFSSISSLVLSREVSRIGFALLMLELAASLMAGVMVETANLARFLLASLSSIILALAVGYLVTLDQRAASSEEVES